MKKNLLLLMLATGLASCIKQEIVPTPTASVSVDGGDYGQFQFSVSGTNIETYNWDFGDGAKATTANPVHTFANNGLHLVTLTAYGRGGNTVVTRSLNVRDVRGNATFWVKTGSSQIEVTIDNTYQATITSVYSGAPSCGSTGTASFPFLTEGTHSFTARQKTANPLSWKGDVLVTGGSCQTMQLSY
ncbi:PKD domain-containing protein [Fibrella forsythiae]|uniref:PKD domain-containing protein n=1 Tax=Fibrella forsythiae TaxID=2817061 RepID=A0ABS3JNX4_9BACT|nr:PKD domain-containing protein [Fibrella forsythiae]MBO0951193.1 PKD domain-containing protein [Fibrella forsythiae]